MPENTNAVEVSFWHNFCWPNKNEWQKNIPLEGENDFMWFSPLRGRQFLPQSLKHFFFKAFQVFFPFEPPRGGSRVVIASNQFFFGSLDVPTPPPKGQKKHIFVLSWMQEEPKKGV